MFFIWGVGSRRNYTNVFVKETCDRCGTTSDINIITDYKCGTIFFIPVLKIARKYYEVCPNCGAFKEISKQEFKQIKASNKNSLVYKANDVVVTGESVEMIEENKLEKQTNVENLISKDDVNKEINEIIKKLKEKNYVLTSEKLDKFKVVLKGQLMKKFNDEKVIDEAIADYFKDVE